MPCRRYFMLLIEPWKHAFLLSTRLSTRWSRYAYAKGSKENSCPQLTMGCTVQNQYEQLLHNSQRIYLLVFYQECCSLISFVLHNIFCCRRWAKVSCLSWEQNGGLLCVCKVCEEDLESIVVKCRILSRFILKRIDYLSSVSIALSRNLELCRYDYACTCSFALFWPFSS